MTGVRRYKYQALVTLDTGNDGGTGTTVGPAPRRMVLRGRNGETRRSQFFTALVSCDDGGPFRPGRPQMLCTLRLAGDDVEDYLVPCPALRRMAMCLSLSERRALSRIGKAVGQSDPRLNSMLAAFSSFNAGESKPRWEQLRLTPRRVLGVLRPGVAAADRPR